MSKWYLIGLIIVPWFLGSCGPEPEPEVIGGNGENSDTLILNISSELPPPRIAPDNPFTRAAVDLGRHLFYEKMLSGDESQACADCHNQSLGFTDNHKSVSEGITGALGTRNAMPLFNLMWHDSFFWDKRAPTMRQQVLMPITNPVEMNAVMSEVVDRLNASEFYRMKFKEAFGTEDIDTALMAKAIEQFLFTVTSDNSRFDQSNRGEIHLTEQELRGFNRLKIKGCFNCHKGALLMDGLSHNTGLDLNFTDKGLGETTGRYQDDGKFKTPSLRNIMVTAPYMHDGRFKTIDEVLDFYDNDIQFGSRNVSGELLEIGTRAKLSKQDIDDVKAFFHTLTDHTYLNNSKFSDPF